MLIFPQMALGKVESGKVKKVIPGKTARIYWQAPERIGLEKITDTI